MYMITFFEIYFEFDFCVFFGRLEIDSATNAFIQTYTHAYKHTRRQTDRNNLPYEQIHVGLIAQNLSQSKKATPNPQVLFSIFSSLRELFGWFNSHHCSLECFRTVRFSGGHHTSF